MENKHLKTIEHYYKNHPFYKEVFDLISTGYNKDFKKLYELNIFLIDQLNKYLSIKTKTVFSSEFKIKTKKEIKIIDLLKINKATKYLSPIGSREYLGQGEIFKKNNIKLEYIDYNCLPYKQSKSKKFISHLSIIDAIFNLGKKTKEIL